MKYSNLEKKEKNEAGDARERKEGINLFKWEMQTKTKSKNDLVGPTSHPVNLEPRATDFKGSEIFVFA